MLIRLLVYLLLIQVVWAAPPTNSNPALAPWYKSLRTPLTDMICCDAADCRHYPVRINSGHYEVLFNDNWLVVDDNTILAWQDNPTGDYVACIDQGFLDHDLLPGPKVICFIRRADA